MRRLLGRPAKGDGVEGGVFVAELARVELDPSERPRRIQILVPAERPELAAVVAKALKEHAWNAVQRLLLAPKRSAAREEIEEIVLACRDLERTMPTMPRAPNQFEGRALHVWNAEWFAPFASAAAFITAVVVLCLVIAARHQLAELASQMRSLQQRLAHLENVVASDGQRLTNLESWTNVITSHGQRLNTLEKLQHSEKQGRASRAGETPINRIRQQPTNAVVSPAQGARDEAIPK